MELWGKKKPPGNGGKGKHNTKPLTRSGSMSSMHSMSILVK